jgi:hypothetical protein
LKKRGTVERKKSWEPMKSDKKPGLSRKRHRNGEEKIRAKGIDIIM